jgi:hypothetical protein
VLREPRSTATGRADELATAADQHARQVGSRVGPARGARPRRPPGRRVRPCRPSDHQAPVTTSTISAGPAGVRERDGAVRSGSA